MHLLAVLALVCLGACEENDVGRTAASGVVTIYSTTDREVFEPVITDFSRLHPEIRLNYVELDAQPLFERFLHEADRKLPGADIMLSSAIDLQVKLVNDGYALKHETVNSAALPPWAKWRDEIFGLTFEPVVMVANSAQFAGRDIPRTRFDLVQSLRSDPGFWQGRIGTYDIASSSVGYFLAAQDARQSSEFGTLLGAMGDSQVRTYQNVSALLDELEAGKVALGYNVLGSYAKRRVKLGSRLRIIYPDDYTLAVVRAAFIARTSRNPAAAHVFLDYLMSVRGQQILATRSDLAAVREEVGGPYGRIGERGASVGPLRPIPIGPGLLTYLDRQKRERFLANWQTAIADHRREPRAGVESVATASRANR